MARLGFTLATTAEVALTTTPKTVAQLAAAANTRVAVKGFQVSFDGISSTAGAAQVILTLQSSSSTGTSAATLAKKVGGTTEALGSSGLFNFSAEPTYSSYLRTYNINPQTGYERAFAQDEEIQLAGGTRLGLVVIASSAVNCHATLDGEE